MALSDDPSRLVCHDRGLQVTQMESVMWMPITHSAMLSAWAMGELGTPRWADKGCRGRPAWSPRSSRGLDRAHGRRSDEPLRS